MPRRCAALVLLVPLLLTTACNGEDNRSEPPDPGAPVSRAPAVDVTSE